MSTDVVQTPAFDRMIDTWVAAHLIDWATGPNGKDRTKRRLRADLESYATDLAGPNPSAAERTLADAAALAWFALRLFEALFASASTSENGLTERRSEFHQRRIDRAHRRYLATLKTLATVRKLALPALQIKVTRNQLNLTGSLSKTSSEVGIEVRPEPIA